MADATPALVEMVQVSIGFQFRISTSKPSAFDSGVLNSGIVAASSAIPDADADPLSCIKRAVETVTIDEPPGARSETVTRPELFIDAAPIDVLVPHT